MWRGTSASSGDRERLRNVVFMGMGEPLHNYDAVMRAVGILLDPERARPQRRARHDQHRRRRPGIRRMADEGDAPCTSRSRSTRRPRRAALALIPAARKWPLDELMDACRHYCAKLRRRIFFELTLIDGKNDSAEDAHAVGRLIRGLPAQVNLIPLNPDGGLSAAPRPAARPPGGSRGFSPRTIGLPSTIRQRRGIDIAAGCGQLAAPA